MLFIEIIAILYYTHIYFNNNSIDLSPKTENILKQNNDIIYRESLLDCYYHLLERYCKVQVY